ncbi:zf-HC2 domain-containing protein [Streptomyces lunalinharesii]|uniref:Zinc-finger domain-containing protein n=1 Tax=Streptomyces lunalinharesii TaxID=333384 RepID=A0ABN3SQ90_9ACTN
MAEDLTCAQLHQAGAELALGVLSGRERAEATAHLDRCADCREYVGQLARVGDGLLGLLPGSAPPAGFETRVVRRLARARAVRDGREAARGFGARRGAWRKGVWLRVASALAVLALGFGFAGWALGTAVEDVVAGPAASAPAAAGTLHAPLTGAGAGHRQHAGDLYAHRGPPGWVFMSVDLADAGLPYSGKVTCLLERTDGSTVRLGSFALRHGYGYWGAPAPVDPSTLAGIRLVSAEGHDLATARFTAP